MNTISTHETYDLYIDENFVVEDYEYLENSEYDAVLLNKISKPAFPILLPSVSNSKIKYYTRLTIDITSTSSGFSASYFDRYKHNVIAIKVSNSNQLKTAIECGVNLITFDMQVQLRLKPGFIKDGINRGLFFEVVLRDCYDPKTRTNWLSNVQDIIEMTKGCNLVVSSGARCFEEIKNPMDIYMFLKGFVKESIAKKIVYENPKKFLESSALKKYSFKDSVLHDQPNDLFKEDFILKKYFN